MIDKLFELFISEGNCECCGSPCKTAICSSCQEDLVKLIDEQSVPQTDTETEAQVS